MTHTQHMPDFAALVTKERNLTEDVAEIAGTTPATVRWWRHVGRGPRGFTLPGSRRTIYMRADLIAWLEDAYRNSQTDA